MKNEAHARIKINKLLEESGVRFFDNELGKANILLENHIKITQQEVDAWGNDFEKVKSGSLDFLLVDSENKPLCVLEAKKEELRKLVYNKDVITMLQDGLFKILAGFTTTDEILKLIDAGFGQIENFIAIPSSLSISLTSLVKAINPYILFINSDRFSSG